MSASILGRKIGMTRLFDDEGRSVPVTVIEVGPCVVSQIKTVETDGYGAVQLAFEDVKARNSTMPVIGHDGKAGSGPKRFHREFRQDDDGLASFELGQQITVDAFAEVGFVDISGTSKGKGFAGSMKRHGHKGQLATHGVERKHRSPGSIGGRSSNAGTGKPKKGGAKAGQMGNKRVTVRSIEVIARDKQKNLLLVKGQVPGAKQGLLEIREAKRLYKKKVNRGKAE